VNLDQARQELYAKIFKKCDCENAEKRKHVLSNGRFQIKMFCPVCGKRGPALKVQSGDENLPELDPELADKIFQLKSERFQRELEQLKSARVQEMQFEYHEYLKTDKWKEIRARVLRRDNYLCRGCLVERATCVHHISYANITDELCFQLVSLCKACHDKAHRDRGDNNAA
jgi:5-methylcytosine-specific restriction endonuclease McrA